MSQFLKKIMGSGSDDQKSQNKTSAEEKKNNMQESAPQPKKPEAQARPDNAAPTAAMQRKEPSAFSQTAPRTTFDSFAAAGQQCTTIGPDVAIRGTLNFAEKAVISGKFSGQINSKGSLFIGRGGKVESDLDLGSCVVEGDLVGNISASGNVELRAKSSLTGDIKAAKLKIEDGVVFKGHCRVGVPEEAAAPAVAKPAAAVKEEDGK